MVYSNQVALRRAGGAYGAGYAARQFARYGPRIGRYLYNRASRYYTKWSARRTINKYKKRKLQFKTTYSKKRKGKTIKKLGKKPKTLSGRVWRLERQLAKVNSYLTKRELDFATLESAVNSVKYGQIYCGSLTQIQSTISALKYFDPSDPATLISVDLDAGTYAQAISVSVYVEATYMNNSGFPIKLTVYDCHLKADTALDPISAYTNSIANIPSASGAGVNSAMLYPSDMDELNDLWKVKVIKKVVLEPGQSVKCSTGTGWFDHDPSVADNHTDNFQLSHKAKVLMCRVEGTICRDATTNTQGGTPPVILDTQKYCVHKVRYDSGGAKLRDILLDDNRDSPSNYIVARRMGMLSSDFELPNQNIEIVAPLGNGTQATSVRVRESTT